MGCNDAARILRILPVFREADGACRILNADKHSPASSARSDCVYEQVAKRIANVRFTNKQTDTKESPWEEVPNHFQGDSCMQFFQLFLFAGGVDGNTAVDIAL